MKRILVMGGTGAMGRYAVPELLRLGFLVDVVALDTLDWEHENLTSSVADAMDDAWLEKTITETRYDVILDFMSYMAAAVSSTLFANAVSAIGWKNLILVWLGLVLFGTLICPPKSSKKLPALH